MSQTDKSIGFIGLGAMGLPMARNLIKAGYQLRVYNRTKSKADELIALGAEFADTPAGVAAPDGIVVTMVANDAALAEIVTGKAGFGHTLGPNGIHLSMSTISPQLARSIADVHDRTGAAYVAAPVSGRPDAAAAQQLTMWVSGAQAAQERVAPMIAAMGRGSSDVGTDPAAGHIAKLAANILVMNTVEILSEVLVFAEQSGLDPQVFAEAITNTLFAAPIFKTYSGILTSGNIPNPGFKLSLALKDINLALDAGEMAGVTLPIVSILRDRLLTGVAKGRGDLDLTVMQQSVREDAGLSPTITH
ncbi:NAD(P)-dependent oxidoreductase [Chamaesiphon sp. VAR_69_metabat_338]|uniref:NAD(P)-dependent oxidoreductase n=1 Tax=Chamaesiphon sp. VAR_69_metabat_338 TaxID=2964704 RepID=UPI00286D878A|nr:NAD(P)-dependent oxidoreductase [Chamaesiphon sp. VAR_69_metabat_338]